MGAFVHSVQGILVPLKGTPISVRNPTLSGSSLMVMTNCSIREIDREIVALHRMRKVISCPHHHALVLHGGSTSKEGRRERRHDMTSYFSSS